MGGQRRFQDKTQQYLSSAVEPPPPLLPAAFLSLPGTQQGSLKEGEHVMCIESQVALEGKCILSGEEWTYHSCSGATTAHRAQRISRILCLGARSRVGTGDRRAWTDHAASIFFFWATIFSPLNHRVPLCGLPLGSVFDSPDRD